MTPQEPADKSADANSEPTESPAPSNSATDESVEAGSGATLADSGIARTAQAAEPANVSVEVTPEPPAEPARELPTKPIPQAKTGSAPRPQPPQPRPALPPKPAADKNIPPPPPFVPKPSLPVSMTMRPEQTPGPNNGGLYPGELDLDFDVALASVILRPRRHSLAAHLLRLIGGRRFGPSTNTNRTVAFDGFRTDLYDEKIERDRRYGTVYTVSEEVNAFLVRLELPRRMPASSLKQTWQLPDEMPDYDYSLALRDDVLTIRAGLRGEAWRRVSYVSSSLPSDFATRIEFDVPVEGFKHRMRDKVLEIIVYKPLEPDSKRAA
jgi:hypothetical protein